MRTFLALCFSVGTTRRIAEAMEQEAQRLGQAGWKLAWVPPANLHVTLKFFGSIPPESLDAIAARLRQRLAQTAPIALRAKGYGAFPVASEGPPRVLWVGVEGGRPLEALQTAVEDDMADLGFAKAERVFHPHLTVARVHEAPAGASFESNMDFGEEKVGELVVYESKLPKNNRAGVEYLARARVPFMK